MPKTRITVNVSEVLAAFGDADRKVKAAIERGMKRSAKNIIKDARSNAPVRSGRLKNSLMYVIVKQGDKVALRIGVDNGTASKYWLTREFGPEGGVITGKETRLAFAPEWSPLFSPNQRTTARPVIQNPKRYGFDRTYNPPGSEIIYGIRKRGGKGKFANEWIPIFVVKDSVKQDEYQDGRFIMPAVRSNAEDLQVNIITEITKAMKK